MASDDRLRRLSHELFVTSIGGGIEPWARDRLVRWLEERTVRAGEQLWAEGEAADRIYFMPHARLRFSRAAGSYLREGRWVIGAHEALADRPRLRTVVSLDAVRAVTIPAEPWLEVLEDGVQMARNIVMMTSRTVTGLHAQVGPDGGFDGPARPCDGEFEGDLSLVERMLLMSRVSLFEGAGVQALTDLAVAAEAQKLPAGQKLFERGAPRRHAFIVAGGSIEVRREDPRVSARFGPGTLAGGAVALGDHALAWEAEAVERSKVLAVPIDLWGDEMDDHFDLVRSAVGALAATREDLIDRLPGADTGELVFR